jgi:hypothetical protein
MLRVIFWVVPRRVVFNIRRFGTLFHLHSRVNVWCLIADVSQHCVCSIFIGLWSWNRHSVPKRWLLNTARPGTTQKITRNKLYVCISVSPPRLFLFSVETSDVVFTTALRGNAVRRTLHTSPRYSTDHEANREWYFVYRETWKWNEVQLICYSRFSVHPTETANNQFCYISSRRANYFCRYCICVRVCVCVCVCVLFAWCRILLCLM